VARVLVVEDDPDIAQLVAHYLEKAGFTTEVTANGGNAATAGVPIIMLTARAEESDRIVGLEIGADDYLAKPFSPGELVARVRALLRRATRAAAAPSSGSPAAFAGHTVAYGSIVMDAERHTVTASGDLVTLTAKEFVLFDYFLKHRGRVLSRDVLLTDVWGYRYTGGTRTVDVHIRRLREKLPLLARSLVTVKQFGYKLLENPDAIE
jgi:two-component system alkaline phosphatase synthesis response regulator PhoP